MNAWPLCGGCDWTGSAPRLQRQIDWLQEQDAGRDDGEIEKLYQRKIALLHQMEELT